MKRFLSTAAMALVLSTGAYAESHMSSFTAVEVDQSTQLFASDLLGARIYATEAQLGETVEPGAEAEWDDLGEVNDMIMNPDGSVQAVILGVGGFLGIGERDIAITMEQLKIVRDGESADDFFLVVNANREAIENAPEFVRQDEMVAEGEAADDTAMTGETEMAEGAASTEGAAMTDTETETAEVEGEGAVEAEVETEMAEAEATAEGVEAEAEAEVAEAGEAVENATNEAAQEVAEAGEAVENAAEGAAAEVSTEMAEAENAVEGAAAEAETEMAEAENAVEGAAAEAETEMAEAENAVEGAAAEAETEMAEAENAAEGMAEEAETEMAEAEAAVEGEAVEGVENTAMTGTETEAEAGAEGSAALMPMDRDLMAAPEVEREGYETVQIDALTAEDLDGIAVYGAEDETVGEIDELLLSEDGSAIQGAVINVGGFLGLGEKPVRVSFDELQIMRGENGDVRVYINASEEALENLPEYEG